MTTATGTASLTLTGAASASPLFVGDTSNALDGLELGAVGHVTITRPAAAAPTNLATKVDKAVAYPTPVMVNGRPT